jgi:hypothetical protein
MLSSLKAGRRDPSMNMIWMQPPRIWDSWLERPTFLLRTAGKYQYLMFVLRGMRTLTRHEINDKVNSSDLIHQLNTPCEKHTLASLDFVVAKDLPNRLLAHCILYFNSGQDSLALVDYELVIWFSVIDSTENFHCFLLLAVVHEPARRLR